MASLVVRPRCSFNTSVFTNFFFVRNLATNSGVKILAAVKPEHENVLTPEALDFVADIHRNFEATRQELLTARATRQARIDAGEQLSFRCVEILSDLVVQFLLELPS